MTALLVAIALLAGGLGLIFAAACSDHAYRRAVRADLARLVGRWRRRR